MARISLTVFWGENPRQVRVPEEHAAHRPSGPAAAVPLGPAVAHPSLAAAVQARYAVAPGAFHDHTFPAGTGAQSGGVAPSPRGAGAALGWWMPTASLQPPQGMALAISSHARAVCLCPKSRNKSKNNSPKGSDADLRSIGLHFLCFAAQTSGSIGYRRAGENPQDPAGELQPLLCRAACSQGGFPKL